MYLRRDVIKALSSGALLGGADPQRRTVTRTPANGHQTAPDQPADPPGVAWQQTFDVGAGGETTTILRPSHGGFLVAGIAYQSEDPDEATPSAFLRKVDANGLREWQQQYGGDRPDRVDAVIETEDGGYLFAGSTESAGDGPSDAWLVKVGVDGTKHWERTYGVSNESRATALVPASDGGYVFAGSTKAPGEDTSQAWLVKVTADGTKRWDRTYDSVGDAIVSSLIETTSGAYLLAGATKSLAENIWDALLLNVSPDGTVQWRRTYGENTTRRSVKDTVNSIIETSDGGYVFVGGTRSKSETSMDAWIGKVTPDGTLEWDQTYNKYFLEEAADVVETDPNEFLFVGISVGKGTYHIPWAVKIDATGELATKEWEQTIGSIDGALFTALCTTSDGEYILTGYTWDGSDEWQDPWLVKLSERAPGGPFDPRVDAFAFANWDGEVGIGADGEQFTLELEDERSAGEEDSSDDGWGIDDPVNVVDRIISSKISRWYISDGHCLGMVLAADEYYRDPQQLPEGIDTTSDLPHPTGRYRAVGERIRRYQISRNQSAESYWRQLAMGLDRVDTKEQLSVILSALNMTHTAPIILGRNLSLTSQNQYHQVLAYHYERREDAGTVEIAVYDPDDRAARYRSESENLNYAFDRPRNTMTVDIETGELIEYGAYEAYAYIDFRSREMANRLNEGDKPAQNAFDEGLFVGLKSPATLEVTTPTGTKLSPIRAPDETAAETTYHEVVWSFDVQPGEYTVDVIGEGDGTYTLETAAMTADGGLVDQSTTGEITTDEVHSFVATVPESNADDGTLRPATENGGSEREVGSKDESEDDSEDNPLNTYGPFIAGGLGATGLGATYKYLQSGGEE